MDLRSWDLADLGAPFTRQSFVAAGGAPRTLDRWLSRGRIRPILYGVYVPTEVPDNLPLRAKAVSLVLPPGAAVARTTAAWLYGVDVRKPGQHTTVPEVECVVPAGCTPIRRPGLRCFTADLADDLTCVEGLPCTKAPRTAADLLRWQPPFMGLGAVDAMAHGGIVTVDQVAAALAPMAGHRNVASARQLLAWCEPLTESFGTERSSTAVSRTGCGTNGAGTGWRHSTGR